MRCFSRLSIITCAFLCLFYVQVGAVIQVEKGVRVGYYEESRDGFFGVDAKFNLLNISVNPNFEWVFVDDGDLFTLNLDGFIDLGTFPLVNTWVGAGYGLIYTKPEVKDSQTDYAFNLIAGAGLSLPLDPYLMIKLVVMDNSSFVVAGGIRF